MLQCRKPACARAVNHIVLALVVFVLALFAFQASSQMAFAQDSVGYSSYSFGKTYRESTYGTPPNGIASTEGCHFVLKGTYPAALKCDGSLDDAAASFKLSGSTGSMSARKLSIDGKTLTLDVTTEYMPGGVLTASASSIAGITCDGKPVSWPELTTVVPTGLEFHVTNVTIGTSSTCASTTIEIDSPAAIRSMNHMLWTSNGRSIIAGTGTAQTTVAHHHNFWNIDLKASAGFIQTYAAAALAQEGYTVSTSSDGYSVTLTANKAVAGEYLGIYNYDDNFLQGNGFTVNDAVTGLAAQKASSLLDIGKRAVISASIAEHTGQPTKPQLTVVDGRYGTLVEGRDYTCSYANNVEFGEGTCTLTGCGTFSGTATVAFTIAHTIVDDDFTFDLTDATFTGAAIEGRVTSATLVENEDYIVRYTNNVNAGTADIYIIGQGKCIGNIHKTFNIVAAAALGKPGTPKLTVGKKQLKVTWTAAKGAASYKVQYCKKGTSKWTTCKTTKCSLVIKKLTKGKQYKVCVIAVSQAKTCTSKTVTSKKIK